MSDLLGEILDKKYELIRLLGKGGMGAVYEAMHTGTGRRVAVKVILTETPKKDPRVIGRFQREAKAAGAIHTKHIAQVLDAGADPGTGTPYLVMEYLEGQDLSQLLKRVGPLPPPIALRIVGQACIGLMKAHAARVVHRDIKPANIFLAQEEDEITVKILDFGIAKVRPDEGRGPDAGLTRTGNFLGSPLYMSPEQAFSPKNIDHRTDIWSLGTVLYRALAGRAPREGLDSVAEIIIALCSEAPRPIREIAPWVSPEISAVVHRALRSDLTARFPSAAAMLDAIKCVCPGALHLSAAQLAEINAEGRPASDSASTHVAESADILSPAQGKVTSSPPPRPSSAAPDAPKREPLIKQKNAKAATLARPSTPQPPTVRVGVRPSSVPEAEITPAAAKGVMAARAEPQKPALVKPIDLGAPRPMAIGQQTLFAPPTEPRPAGAAVRAPEPVVDPRARAGTSSDVIELLWFDRSCMRRVRKSPAWRSILDELEEAVADLDLDDAASTQAPEGAKDRREMFEILTRGEAATASALDEAIANAARPDGKFVPPLALIRGELEFPLDEMKTLRAMIAAVTPFLAADEALRAAVQVAGTNINAGWLETSSGAAKQLIVRIKEAFCAGGHGSSPTDIEAHVEATLLKQRHYERRTVLGAPYIRALFRASDAEAPIPAYLPDELSKQLPAFARMKIRGLVELYATQDHSEASRNCIRVLAVARALPRREPR